MLRKSLMLNNVPTKTLHKNTGRPSKKECVRT